MKFQLLDADYIVTEKPIVRLFGKTEEGRAICVYHEGFYPYFYAEDGELGELPGEKLIRVEKVKKFPAMGYHEKPKDFWKITLKSPKYVREMRSIVEQKGLKTFESAILFVYRFMIDHGLKGMGWVEADVEAEKSGMVTVPLYRASSVKYLEHEKDTDLKILSFDIETLSKMSEGIDMERDPIIMISLAFSTPYHGMDRLVLVAKPFEGPEVEGFEDEKQMLERFQKIIHEFDPDIITGYNIQNFDLPYVITRFKVNGMKPYLGRVLDKPTFATRTGMNWRVKLVGRTIADVYTIVKSDIYFPYKLHKFDLGTVSSTVLGETKTDVKYKEIYGLWNGTKKELERLIAYAKQDAVLVMKIINKVTMFDKYVALSRLSGVLLEDSFGGQSKRIETYVLHNFRDKGFTMPASPSESEMKKRIKERDVEGLKGAIVLEPVVGFHNDSCIDVLDFKSLYPSLIITFNICPTTIVLDNIDVKSHESPAGYRIVDEDVRKGIIPEILDQILTLRFSVKKAMKQEEDPVRKRYLNSKQMALKIMANSFYGYTGYLRARLYLLEVASSITSYGRWAITKTKKMVEEELGYKVIYGDTDSVFVKVFTQDLDEAEKLGREIGKYVSDRLPGRLVLDFEKTYKSFLILTKKRYAGWKFEKKGDKWVDKIDMKGIETVRRDWCPLVTETMLEVLNIILKEGDIEKAKELVRQIVEKLKHGQMPIEKLTIVKGITKDPSKYDGMLPHVIVAKKMKQRNPLDPPMIGDRIGYVIIKGNRLVSERAEDPQYVKEHGLEVDYEYYINNQLLPPIERIFEVLGVQRTELLGEGRQSSIMDMFGAKPRKPSNHRPDPEPSHQGSITGTSQGLLLKVKKPEPVLLHGIEGFQCEKCKRIYSSMPLSERCECGGRIKIISN